MLGGDLVDGSGPQAGWWWGQVHLGLLSLPCPEAPSSVPFSPTDLMQIPIDLAHPGERGGGTGLAPDLSRSHGTGQWREGLCPETQQGPERWPLTEDWSAG